MRRTAKKRSGRKEVATAGPSGMKFAGHTPDGPIWEKRGGKRGRTAIPSDQADQSMVERNIPIAWGKKPVLKTRLADESARWEGEHGPRIDTAGMTEIIPVRRKRTKKLSNNK